MRRLLDDLLHERASTSRSTSATGRRTARPRTSRSPSSWPSCWRAARRSSASSRWPGCPRPTTRVFESENFARASIDGFFLSVELPADGDADKAWPTCAPPARSGVELVDGVRAMMRPRRSSLSCFVLAALVRWRRLRREHPGPDGRPPAARRSAISESDFFADGLVDARATRGHGAARAHHAEPPR